MPRSDTDPLLSANTRNAPLVGLAENLRGLPDDEACTVAMKVLDDTRPTIDPSLRKPEIASAFRPGFAELDKRLRRMQTNDPTLDSQWQKLEGMAYEQALGEGMEECPAALRERWRQGDGDWPKEGSVDDEWGVPELDAGLCERICRYSRLKRIWSRYAVTAYWHNPRDLPEQTGRELRDFAVRDLVQLRMAIHIANRQIALADLRRYYQTAQGSVRILLKDGPLHVLGCFGGLWGAVRAWLLVFRELRLPAVGEDLLVPLGYKMVRPGLTYPPVVGDFSIPLAPGGVVSSDFLWMQHDLTSLLHSRFRFEERTDPSLRELRTEFARFCIGRLKTVRNDSKRYGDAMQNLDDAPLVEPDPVWREGYLRAAMAVQAPDLKGHDFDVLRRAGSHDPDENVSSTARELYKQLHATEELPDETRRRRLIFAGLWEIRRAHRRALGLCVDERAAQGVRDREARETTAPVEYLERMTNVSGRSVSAVVADDD